MNGDGPESSPRCGLCGGSTTRVTRQGKVVEQCRLCRDEVVILGEKPKVVVVVPEHVDAVAPPRPSLLRRFAGLCRRAWEWKP